MTVTQPGALLGISTGHAGQLLVTAGQNIERLRDDGAFAALCGASPIPVSSGRRNRHRLNPGGDRNANRTLHMIAVVPLRYCQRSRAYAQRRVTEGKTKPEIIRCLKRYSRPRDLPDALRRPRRPRPAAADTADDALDIYRNVRGRSRQQDPPQVARMSAIATDGGCCTKPSQKSRSALAQVHARAAVRDDLGTDGPLATDGMAVFGAHR